MLEKFTLKRSPAVIVLKIISSLLTIALIVAFIFAFYLVPEKYDTEADVRNSRAFDAIVDAAETVYKKEIYNYNYDELFVQQSFMPYKITWIYDATLDGYIIYSKIDYTIGFSGENKTAYCKTVCGDLWYKQGNHIDNKFGIKSEIITEDDYLSSKSRFISSEQEYNDLAVSTVYWTIKKHMKGD